MKRIRFPRVGGGGPAAFSPDRRRAMVLAGFFLFIEVNIFLLTAVAVTLSTQAVQRNAHDGARRAASATALAVDNRVSLVFSALSDLAKFPAIASLAQGRATTLDQESTTVRMNGLVGSSVGFDRVFVSNVDGTILSYAPTEPVVGTNLFQEDWYRRVHGSRTTIVADVSKPAGAFFGTIKDGTPALPLATPVFASSDPNAAVVGYLVGVVGLQQIQTMIDQISTTDGISLTLIDGDANDAFIARPKSELSLGTTIDLGLVRQALAGHSALVDAQSAAGPVFSSYSKLPGLNWVVVSDLSAEQAYAEIQRLEWTGVVIGLIVSLVLIFGMAVGFRQLGRLQQSAMVSQRAEAMERLNDAAYVVHNETGPAVFERIADTACKLTDAELAGLVVYAPGSEMAVESFAHSGPDDLYPQRFPALAELLIAHFAIDHKARVLDARGLYPPSQQSEYPPVGPLLVVPLQVEDEIAGMLAVARRHAGDQFDVIAEGTLLELGHHAMTAIQKLRHEQDLNAKNEELAEASRLKSEFLAKMSHELRTPLSAIIGFSDLILDGADGDLTDDLSEDISQINRSGKALLDLINDILDLSKIEAGRMVFEIQSVSMPMIIQEVIAVTRPLAEAKSLRILYESDDEPAALVAECDAMRTRQVVTNLVSNAIKFTPQGGVTLTCKRLDASVEVSVIDSGIGIDAEAQARIFDEFVQADGSTSRKFGGTGLGLSISKRLIELQGGVMGLESTPGRGSRFWFTVPVPGGGVESEPGAAPELIEPIQVPVSPTRNGHDTRAAAAAPPRAKDWPDQTRDVILVVDDDDQARELIVRRLREAGFEAIESRSAEEAVQMAQEEHPMAITLDIMMPGMDGWKALGHLKSDRMTADIPVVVVSIVDGKDYALSMGAAAYITKPFSNRELRSVIASVLPNVRSAHVLHVDDEPSARELVSRSLKNSGIRVTSVGSGADALTEVARRTPDAMIVDLMMPEMTGFELISILRARPMLDGVPIIVVSARELSPEDRGMLSNRIDRFIAKGGVRPSDLGATVRQAIQARRRVSQVEAPTR